MTELTNHGIETDNEETELEIQESEQLVIEEIEAITIEEEIDGVFDDIDEEITENEELVEIIEVTQLSPILVETEAYNFLVEAEERWKEIDLLILKIEENKEKEDVYNVLCRSTVVLLVAQLEGYIKDLAKALIDDLSYYNPFVNLPKIIKRNYVESFLYTSQDKINDFQVRRLLDLFSELNPKVSVEPFLYDKNKNPSPSVIENILNNFGINDFFGNIHESNLDKVFENDTESTLELIGNLKDHLLDGVKYYPYEVEPSIFAISKKQRKKKDRTLYMTFLDDLLKKRHSVAHGSNFTNELNERTLKEFQYKSKIIQYAIALELFSLVVVENRENAL